jgi:hypothetical protein
MKTKVINKLKGKTIADIEYENRPMDGIGLGGYTCIKSITLDDGSKITFGIGETEHSYSEPCFTVLGQRGGLYR